MQGTYNISYDTEVSDSIDVIRVLLVVTAIRFYYPYINHFS